MSSAESTGGEVRLNDLLGPPNETKAYFNGGLYMVETAGAMKGLVFKKNHDGQWFSIRMCSVIEWESACSTLYLFDPPYPWA